MPGIILHHCPRSPFSEKVRLALGLKRLRYGSVSVPSWMPKPDRMPLTGGYRRTPVTQVGADVFCDTAMILRQLERMQPAPSLYPGATEGIAEALAWWAEKFMFMPAIGLVLGLVGDRSSPALLADRKAFFGFAIDKASMLDRQEEFSARLAAHVALLEDMLRGRPYLLGDGPGAADLAAYHPLWFARGNDGAALEQLILGIAQLDAWMARIAAIGHGMPEDLTGPDALDIAAAAEPDDIGSYADIDPAIGRQVRVTADDSGRDPVDGVLLAASARAIVLRRRDPRIGEVNLHFPRAGFDLEHDLFDHALLDRE
jgi:glutathione S-transferase